MACAVGTYKIVEGSDDCLDCEAGKYSGATSASSCLECSTGKYSGATGATSDSTCLVCGAGKFSAKGASACLDCETGKFSGMTSAWKCIDCAAGKYSGATGATSDSTCLECEAGTYSAKAAAVCTKCSPGTYNAETAASACSNCQPGKFSSNGGNEESSCILCGPDTYSGLSANECTNCPGNAAAPAGSVSITDCKCIVGYSGPDGGPCVASQSLSESPQINMVVELPYTAAEFNEVKENFKRGVAAAVGADATIVKINKVSAASARRVMLSSRKLLSSGVDVDFSVIVPDGLDANTMANGLTIENLNTNLEQQGIREVIAVKSGPTVSQTSEEKSGSKENQMIIYAVVPAVVVILAIVAYWFYWKRKTANAPQPAGGFDAHPPPVAEFAFGGFDPPPGADGFAPPPPGFSPPPPYNPSDDVTKEPPDSLCCPIGLTLMEDPVILVETGHTYERKNIEAYLNRCVLCESVRGCERARRVLAL